MTDATKGLATSDAFHPHLRDGRSTSAVFGVLWSSLQALIPTMSAAAVFFISALFLSPEDFGLVGLASSIVMTVIAFSPLAFAEALVQRKTLTKEHADSVFWMTVAFALVCYVPVSFGAGAISNLIGHPEIAVLLPVLALRIPFELAASVPNAIIMRTMRFKLIAVRTAVATLGSVMICLTMLFAGFGYWALVASQVSASFIACVLAFWVCGWRPGVAARLSALKDLMRYGVFASGTRMLNTMKLDHLVLGVLAGPAVLGLFILAQRLYNMLTQIIGGAMSSVTLSLLSTLQGDRQKTADAFGIASFVSAAVSFPMFCLLGLLAPNLLRLVFDPEWAEAAFAVQAFCVVGVLACIGVVQSALIKSQGKANQWFYYQLLQQSTSILVIAVTYQYGLSVMMVVLVAKSMLVWPISVAMTTRLLDCSVVRYFAEFRVPVFGTAVMALAVLAVPNVFAAASESTLLVLQILIGSVVYGAVVLTLSRKRIHYVRHLAFPKGELAR